MENSSTNQIRKAIENHDTIIIHRHVSPDPDALGSQIGLKQGLQNAFPEKNVYAVGESSVSLSFLGSMDDVPDETYEGALAILLDTANTARISDVRYQQAATTIKIDHHPERESFGTLSWVNTFYSSTAEMVWNFLDDQLLGSMDSFVAFSLYAGIVGDTGRFRYPHTSPEALRAAADLLTYGIDTSLLFEKLYSKSRHYRKAEGMVKQHYSVSPEGIGYFYMHRETRTELLLSEEETSLLVECFADTEEVDIWVFAYEKEEDAPARARIRSKDLSINEIAAEFQGGGHPLASGATLPNGEDDLKRLVDALDRLKEEAKNNPYSAR